MRILIGILFWGGLIGAILIYAIVTWQNMSRNDAVMGVRSGDASHRLLNVNYLGGHPRAPSPKEQCNLIVTSSAVAVEKGAQLLLSIPMGEVREILVETEEEAKRRLTATRLLMIGIFAFAFLKKTKGSVPVTVDTEEGPLVLERTETSKPETLKAMSPALTLARAYARGQRDEKKLDAIASTRPLDVADEIRKLAELRDNGLLTESEFYLQKKKLLDT